MSAIGAVTDYLICACTGAQRRCKWSNLHPEIRQALQAIDIDLDDYSLLETGALYLPPFSISQW